MSDLSPHRSPNRSLDIICLAPHPWFVNERRCSGIMTILSLNPSGFWRKMSSVRLVLFAVLFSYCTAAAMAQKIKEPALFTVGMTTRAFVDTARKDWQDMGPRPLNTVIWYPAAAGFPIKPFVATPEIATFFGIRRSESSSRSSPFHSMCRLSSLHNNAAGPSLTWGPLAWGWDSCG
jgi:hypothetical protein